MRVLALVLALLTATPAFAVLPGERLADPALEERARALSQDLRCMVCQNQSIDDSDAPLARDLRILVRERLVAGDDDKAVVDFVVARYGDFVLLRPPFNARTLLLWGAPFLILFAGVAFVWRRGRQRMGEETVASVPLTDEERRRVDRLLRDEQG